MFLLKIKMLIIFMICIFMMLLVSIISKKSFNDREKSSPFECGFDPKSFSRLPFSIHFFLIAIIFLIFDIEISLLLPLIFIMKSINLTNYLLISFMFLFILLFGLYFEWHQGALNWMF